MMLDDPKVIYGFIFMLGIFCYLWGYCIHCNVRDNKYNRTKKFIALKVAESALLIFVLSLLVLFSGCLWYKDAKICKCFTRTNYLLKQEAVHEADDDTVYDVIKQVWIDDRIKETKSGKSGSGKEIEDSIVEIYYLKQAMEKKNVKDSTLFDHFQNEVSILKVKIKKECGELDKCTRNSHTNNQLKIIQRKMAYRDMIESNMKETKNMIATLSINLDRAYADMQIVNVLGDDEVSQEYVKIDEFMNECRSHLKVVDKKAPKLKYKPMSEVWAEINQQ